MAGDTVENDLLIFISYRRDDSAGHAGRLHDDLAGIFSPEQLFFDVDAIPPGVDFAASISAAVGRCKALIALIGPRWIAAAAADGTRRIDDPRDYVRLEIEAALKRDILVIPVLLQGTHMPKARDLPEGLKSLARRNALELRDSSWRSDLDALAAGLGRLAARPAGQGLRGDSEAFWTSAPADVELPYLGLRAFDEDDARFFFGREHDVDQLIERIRENRFLAVFGPSGSGKSSLVRAGLTRALRSGAIRGSGEWRIEVLRPGARPLEALAARLGQLNPHRTMAELVDALAADPRTLDLETTQAVVGRPDGERVVWLIDQAEELFTLCRDEEARAAAIANLVRAGLGDGGSAIVILAMRADFYQRCAVYPALAAAISASQYLVSPMSEDSLRRAIEEPARLVGLSFEPGLVDTIVEDVAAQPGALPLLQHALFELYARRRGTTLTLEGYRATGGVEGALANRAEFVYSDLGDNEKVLVRRVMLRLTQPGEGTVDTRRRSSLRDLPSGPGEAGPVRHVVAELADARLVTLGSEGDGGEPVVEIAHEALLRAWPRVREWIEQDREAIRVQRRIADATSEWQRLNQVEDALLRGVRLAEATDWQARQPDLLNDSERAFVGASAAAATSAQTRADRRRRLTVVAALGLTAVFVGLSLLTFAAYRGSEAALGRALAAESAANDTIAQLAENQAELDRQRRIAIGRSLVNEAGRSDQEYDAALLLGLEAREFAGADANATLLDQVYAWGPLERTIRLDRVVGASRFAAADDLSTAAFIRDGKLMVQDLVTGEEQTLGDLSEIESLAFTADGRMLLAVGTTPEGESRAAFWTLADGAEHAIPATGGVTAAAFSNDGTRVATHSVAGDDTQEVAVWSTTTRNADLRVSLTGRDFRALALNDDGSTLVIESATADGTGLRIDLWDVAGGTSSVLPEVPPGATGDTRAIWPPMVFDPTGEVLALTRSDEGLTATVDLWSLGEQPKHLATLELGPFTITALDFSFDGLTLAVGGMDGTIAGGVFIYQLDSPGGNVVDETFLPAPIGDLSQVRFLPDASRVFATSYFGSSIAVWSVGRFPEPPGRAIAPPELADSTLVAVGPEGERLAFVDRFESLGSDWTQIDILDVGSGLVRTLADFPGSYGAVAIGSDVDAYADTSRLWIANADGGAATTLDRENVIAAAFSGDSRQLAIAQESDAFGDRGSSVIEVLAVRVEEDGQPQGGSSWTTSINSFDIPGLVEQLAFSPDGKTLAATSIEGPLFNATTLTMIPLSELGVVSISFARRLRESVRSLAWSRDGTDLMAIRSDRALITWDVASGLVTSASMTPGLLDRQPKFAYANALSDRFMLSPEGETVVTGGPSVLWWNTSQFTRPIESVACAIAGRNLSIAEWDVNLPGEPYDSTCPGFPLVFLPGK